MAEKRGKREQRAERNRKKLLDAAMKVFSRKGYHKATVDEICRRANLGKGTVYQYFANKKDLFLGIVDSFAAELGEYVADALVGVEDDLARIRTAISAYMEFHCVHRNFYQLVIHEESSFTKELMERFRAEYFSHLQVLEEVIRTGMKNGKMKKMDAGSATFGLVGMCNLTIFRWLLSEEPYPLEREVPLILEIFLYGIVKQRRRAGA